MYIVIEALSKDIAKIITALGGFYNPYDKLSRHVEVNDYGIAINMALDYSVNYNWRDSCSNNIKNNRQWKRKEKIYQKTIMLFNI